MRKELLRGLRTVCVVAVVLELVVFNFAFWESLSFNSIDSSSATQQLDSDGNLVVELENIDAPVRNVHLNPFVGENDYVGEAVSVVVSATDSGNSEYLSLPQTEVVYGIPESAYIRLHLVGNSTKLRVTLMGENAPQPQQVPTNQLFAVNVVRPLHIVPLRVALIFFVGMLFVLCRPRSKLYSVELDLRQRWQLVCVITSVLIVSLVFAAIGRSCYDPTWDDWSNLTGTQYPRMAESLLQGRTWLDVEPPTAITELENPYDTHYRDALLGAALPEGGPAGVLDYAYFEGHYYSYFGVVPTVLFFMPWRVITGSALRTGWVVIVLSCLMAPAVFWLLYEIVRRYLSRISLGLFILAAVTLTLGGGVLYFVQFPNLYSLPIVCALLFTTLGLSLWLRSSSWREGGPSKLLLVVGSLFMALVMGCRPSLAVFTLLAFVVFYQQIRERWFFSKRGIANTLCVILPYLLVGGGLMWYNAARFGSPLDFGATYNITSLDMTHRGFLPSRFFLGFWEYLFQPFDIEASFPYMSVVASHGGLAHDYQGQVINEPLLGGFFAFNVVGLFVFLVWRARGHLRENGIFGLVTGLILCSVVVIGLDVQVVGMTLRYLSDFSLPLLLAALLVALTLLSAEQDKRMHGVVLLSVVVLCALCVATNLFALLAEGRYNELSTSWPSMYYAVKYQLCMVH